MSVQINVSPMGMLTWLGSLIPEVPSLSKLFITAIEVAINPASGAACKQVPIAAKFFPRMFEFMGFGH
jgi:hypothetical protein